MEKLGFCVIDEVHLVIPWSQSFRESYSTVVTLIPRSILRDIPCNVRLHEPIDRKDLVYSTCTLKYSITGSDFPDLAWLNPDNLTTAQSITPTLIAVAMVAIANALVKWLRKKLKEVLTNGENLVFPFHSIIPQEDRLTTLQELKAGTVQIVVATTAAQVGLDMAIRNVVILDLPHDFEAMTQWNGRAGWDGQGCHAIIYTPDAIRIENVFDLDGDPAGGRKKTTNRALKLRSDFRDSCPPGFVDYFNAPCLRKVIGEYYGEPYEKPKLCCEGPGCYPGPNMEPLQAAERYVENLDKGNLPKYNAAMLQVGIESLRVWQEKIWMERGRVGGLTNLDAPSSTVSNHSIELLAAGMHQGYSEERMKALAESWGSHNGLSVREQELLVEVIRQCNGGWVQESRSVGGKRKERATKERATEAVAARRPGGGSLGGEDEVTSASILGPTWGEGKRKVVLTKKAANCHIHTIPTSALGSRNSEPDFRSPTTLPSPSPCRLPRGYPTSGSDTPFGLTPEHSGSDPNLDTFQTKPPVLAPTSDFDPTSAYTHCIG
ncbi:P-loop containing nucleoside triphosphate hydrolase protein [Cantharellus anzutake]|uniref:P-loop containing nucleoside triphosphate hydrolase protein n=1 Tax=Cantharellus anzutake TaxID=1750568 RepID=UPI001904C37A|nr:P-loop containing nucleoside triphosphate hydrolase protein [Cantharellus anzutake]KAF8324612.1 P-loop containing nucleoside triphosphate hydrolase protein [Cantharellus anzutake]